MAFWLDIAAFLVKALIIVAAIGGLAVLIARLARSGEAKDREIKVRSLNERYDDMRDAMDGALLDKKERKALAKSKKKEVKAAAKARRGQEPGKRIFVLGVQGRHARKRRQAPGLGNRRCAYRGASRNG